jgi:YVTN family beta-propeller protein
MERKRRPLSPNQHVGRARLAETADPSAGQGERRMTLKRHGLLAAGLLMTLVVAIPVAAAVREIGAATTEKPGPIPGGANLPNGWRITPAAPDIADLGDLVLKLVETPDRRAIVAVNSGYLPHGLTVMDERAHRVTQTIAIKSAWLGLAWSPDGRTLYVAGGNAAGDKDKQTLAPVYAFGYRAGRLTDKPIAQFSEDKPIDQVWWSGVAADPVRPLLYAADRGLSADPSNISIFNTRTGRLEGHIPVGVSPYEAVASRDGSRLYVSNWSSRTVSIIDARARRVIATIDVGANPNDMLLSPDGRLFVACSGDNTVDVIDTRKLAVIERISTTLSPKAPEGATPNALALDRKRGLLFVANADNDDVAVVRIVERAHSEVAGFIPTGWYPSALALGEGGRALYIGAAKGEIGHADLKGPESPLATNWDGDESVKTLQRSSIERLPLEGLMRRLPAYSRQVMADTPYHDDLLRAARASSQPSVIPAKVGAGSPIQHVIYIIKENRTYDQVLGDLPHADGDARLAIFGAKVTPNIHALAQQFVTFDNLYADGEVSEDGHSWSNAAYATDFNEKSWPANYGGHSALGRPPAYVPAAGYFWDLAKRHGLTYRSYGEYATRVSTGATMDAAPGIAGLRGHVAPDYKNFAVRDTENVKVFLKEFDGYEANFDNPDPEKRLPNYIVMGLPEDHTKGTLPGAFTPVAAVASNDFALGELVDRVSHSRYWASTAIFVIEDDAQDGPDHVDARRTVALAISPYIRRGTVDATLYSTSSMIRTMELLLGLPPMSQYDAAATPFYAAFGVTPDLTPFNGLPAQVDLNAKNAVTAWGAGASAKMDLADEDRAPMHQLNEIIWKSVRGPGSPMPPPVHRYRPLADRGG